MVLIDHPKTEVNSYKGVVMATENQHPPVHHEGWMESGHKTVFCWVPVP
jgi:hypothetical protein